MGAKAQYYRVVGYVADSSRSPIPDVSIFITNGSVAGTSDYSGSFNFELRSGQYELVFSHPNFQQVTIKVVLDNKNDTFNIILPGLTKTIGTVEITRKWVDPGPAMMKKAIEKREYWAAKMPPYSARLYIRAFEEYNKPKKANNIWHAEETEEQKDAKKRNKKPDEPVANMAEVLLDCDYLPPDKIKETRIAVQKRGDIDGLFYLSTTEGDFNLYQNLVKIRGLGNAPVMSPLSNTALLAYKFNFLGSYKDNQERRILKIRMQPRSLSSAVFGGEIHLVDSLYCIYRAEYEYPKPLLNEYNQFRIAQEYQLSADSQLLPARLRFDYFAKAGKGKFNGYTLVSFKELKVQREFPKGHFGLEVSSVADSAYDKDSSFWAGNRSTPLNSAEIRFISRNDSIKRVLNSKVYLDSVEKATNKVTIFKLLFQGQQYQNRNKGLNLDFQPLMFIVQPWFPGGTRINMWNTFEKTFKNKREIQFIENLSYGINNQDLRGTVIFSTLFDPYHRGNLYLSAGRDFGFINPNAAFLDLARRGNFYQNTHFTAYVRRELINGLYLRIQGEFSDRKDIGNFTFDAFGDSLFENNLPTRFSSNRALFADINLSYTPFQKYIREPKQKIILGSRWPTFSINYRQAIAGVFGSNIDYSYLEFRIDQDFALGLLGRSELKAVSGSFLQHRNLSPVDYRYQRRGDYAFFTPPMYAFQTLDSTFVTFKRFYEVHYRHHFNGAIINKIPFMKFLKLRESAGVNLLYAPERRNMFFYEAYVGIDKLVRIWRERFKMGLYYTIGYSNIFEKPIYGLKFNFEFFDRRNNTW